MLVELGEGLSPEVNKRVRRFYRALQTKELEGISECIPAYRSLLVQYDPLTVQLPELKERLRRLEGNLSEIKFPPPKEYEIPVLYGGEQGPDLGFVAEYNNLTDEEVIKTHSSKRYLIYMIGFTPGFPYLGVLPDRIRTPRLETPRKKVPTGSVGIADRQTGIYPTSSPGGWRLIGQTPIRLFRPDSQPPVRFRMGDYISFSPIASKEYEALKREKDCKDFLQRTAKAVPDRQEG